MTFSSTFGDMLKDEVTVQEYSGRDAYGSPSYGSPVTYKCRVVYKNRLVRNTEGSLISSSFQVWMDWIDNITEEWLITLPGGETPPILSIERFKDEVGESHTKVFFQ